MRILQVFAAVALLALGGASWAGEEKPEVELPKADADGWISLFNGKDLAPWDGDPKVWRVENDYIQGKVDKIGYNTFLILNKKLANFVIESKFMLVDDKGNSGIQVRSKVHDWSKWVVGGYQPDIGAGWYGALYEERGRGILFKPKTPPELKKNDWNVMKVTANGPKITVELNGTVTGEWDEKDEVKGAKEGIIALQYHSPGNFEVRFKDIKLKLLDK